MKLLEISEVEFFPFYQREGAGSLEEKIKQVPLRGIARLDGEPVRVYQNAQLKISTLTPEDLRQRVFTGQPMVYQTHLDFLAQLEKMTLEKTGERITQLTQCMNLTSRFVDEAGEEQTSRWTLIPPVVEENTYPLDGMVEGKLRYDEFNIHLPADLRVNAELGEYTFGSRRYKVVFPIICDGIHRIYLAYQRNEPVTVAYLSGVLEGFPYYAHPKPFEQCTVVPSHDHEHDPEYAALHKVHVLEGEGAKRLYRLFPAAGLYTGGVRPDAVLKK